jgi:quinol monooxygenase YgiN
MIIAKIIMNALPKKRKEVLKTLLSMIAQIRQKRGCSSYQIFQGIEEENVFNLVQEWETSEDMEYHNHMA